MSPRPPAFRTLLLGLALLATACGGGGGGSSAAPGSSNPPPAAATLTAITLAPSAPALNVGMTADLTATSRFSDGSTAPSDDATCTWTSSAPSVATVSGAGLVTGLTAGTATITATKGGIQGAAIVTVASSAATLTSITLNPTSATVNVGQTADFTATAHWSDGSTTASYDSSVSWTSSAPAIATVNSQGLVTGVSAGSAVLTASAQGHSATAALTIAAVAPTLSSLSLNPTSGTLTVGQTLDLTATANWSNGTSTVPYDANVTWTSSNPSVATVNVGGVVSAAAAGTTTITASAAGKTATCAITVTAPAPTLTSLTMSLTSKSLTVGQVQELYVDANWSNGTSTHPYATGVTWTTSNAAVATLVPGAFTQVTAAGVGTATITATASGKSATCVITVSAAAPTLSSLSLDLTSASGTVGQTMDLTATANWSNGTSTSPYDSSCTWTSSNPGVATVNGSGFVTAVGAGTATITASASGKSATCVVTITAPPTFDSRLVGTWQWIGTPDGNGANYGSFYHFYANGTFTYTLIYQGGTGCIAYSQIVAYHQGTFSTQGSLDNLASAGKIIFNCSTHYDDWTNCGGAVTRTSANDPNGNPVPSSHFHWAAFANATTLRSSHGDDFINTGTLDHAKQP